MRDGCGEGDKTYVMGRYLPTGGGLGDLPTPAEITGAGVRVCAHEDGDGGEISGSYGGDTTTGGTVGVMGGENASGLATVTERATERPFILSEGLPPVPHKLVARRVCGYGGVTP